MVTSNLRFAPRKRIFSYYFSNGTGPFTSHFQDANVNVGDEVILRNSNRDYRVNIAKKVDATTNYSRSKYTYQPLIGRAESFRSVGLDTWTAYTSLMGCFGTDQINNAPEDSSLSDEALGKLKRRLSSNLGKMDLMVPVVELRDLRRTIRDSATLTTTFLKTILEIKKTRGKSALKYASKAWLNYSFGINPLVQDTFEALDSISSFLDRDRRTIRCQGIAKKVWTTSAAFNEIATLNSSLSCRSQAVHQLSYMWIAGLDWDVKCSNRYDLTDHLGLGFEDIPSVAWELLAFSWIIDYFSNVGEYLADTFEIPPGTATYVVRDMRYTCDVFVSGTYRPTSSNTAMRFSSVRPGSVRYDSFVRTKYATLPRIGLHFKSVDQVGIGMVNKVLNLASVLVSMRR